MPKSQNACPTPFLDWFGAVCRLPDLYSAVETLCSEYSSVRTHLALSDALDRSLVSALSLALALIAAPVRAQHPVQIILSKTLSTLVFCFAAVFLLEYACGIRVPDLDIFFLPDSSGQRVTLYAARPTPHSATTSLLFASALLIFHPDSSWRKRAFQIGVLAALVLPTLACFSYLLEFRFPAIQSAAPRIGLSFPASFFTSPSAPEFSGSPLAQKSPKPAVSRPAKTFRRWV